MNDKKIIPIVMPKWGLAMREGKLVEWHVEEGTEIQPGDEIMDVETDKIANVVEAADGGLLRRCIGTAGEFYQVRALLGVMAPVEVLDTDIDAYIKEFVQPKVDQEENFNPVSEFANLPVGRIRFTRREGDGIPVVLIHGFGGDLDNWLFNIDAFGSAAPVYALDLPGHGQSEKSVDAPDLGMLVDAVVQFMDHLSISRAHLVGHSMGGLVSGQVAVDHPTRVASLTLISAAGLGEQINGSYMDGFVMTASRKDLKGVLGFLFSDGSLVSREMVDNVLKYKRIDGVQGFLKKLNGKLFTADKQNNIIVKALDALDCPVQVIWGEDDAIIPQNHANALNGAHVTIIANAGHMVQMENASRVNELIKSQL